MAISRRRFVETLGASGALTLGGSARAAQGGGPPPMRIAPADLAKLIRLDSNENPNPPGPSVIKAVTQALAQGHRYPLNFIDLREEAREAPRRGAGERRGGRRLR